MGNWELQEEKRAWLLCTGSAYVYACRYDRGDAGSDGSRKARFQLSPKVSCLRRWIFDAFCDESILESFKDLIDNRNSACHSRRSV